MTGHLGAALTALVDGELDHAARERALVHLMRCDACRAEAAAARLLKTRLRDAAVATPLPGEDLAARLRGLAGAGPAAPGRLDDAPRLLERGDPIARTLVRPAEVLAAPRGALRPPSAPPARRAAGGPGRRRVPRSALSGAVLVFGLGAVLALSAPPHRAPTRTPVDPTSDVQLVDQPGPGEVPLPARVGVTRARLLR